MPNPKQNNGGGFENILAGLDRSNAKGAPAAPARLAPSEPQRGGGRPRAETSLRRLLHTFSFPWPPRIPGLMWNFGRHPSDAYAEAACEAKPAARPAPPANAPPKAASSGPSTAAMAEDAVIAEELGLNQSLGTVDLKRIRRDFAKKNHPDRFEPAMRTGAERRMSIANMLIDEMMR
ncbi:MAG: hypothetical protein L0Y60_15285, partial [Beijerinckiaceae bacterium]|nr:hypothetical protein [Beijerinckiaceae bacterium]